MKYVFSATVLDLKEDKLRKHVTGTGENAIFAEEFLGWRLVVDFNRVPIGMRFPSKPEFSIGDRLKLTLEKEL